MVNRLCWGSGILYGSDLIMLTGCWVVKGAEVVDVLPALVMEKVFLIEWYLIHGSTIFRSIDHVQMQVLQLRHNKGFPCLAAVKRMASRRSITLLVLRRGYPFILIRSLSAWSSHNAVIKQFLFGTVCEFCAGCTFTHMLHRSLHAHVAISHVGFSLTALLIHHCFASHTD